MPPVADEVTPLPLHGEVFVDAHDPSRTCRVSWHPDGDVFVLSIWHASTCAATFRLARPQLPAFVGALLEPLGEADPAAPRAAEAGGAGA